MTTTQSKPLFTTREISKVLGVNPMRLSRAIRRGLLRPDFETLSLSLFRPSRVPRIMRLLQLT